MLWAACAVAGRSWARRLVAGIGARVRLSAHQAWGTRGGCSSTLARWGARRARNERGAGGVRRDAERTCRYAEPRPRRASSAWVLGPGADGRDDVLEILSGAGRRRACRGLGGAVLRRRGGRRRARTRRWWVGRSWSVASAWPTSWNPGRGTCCSLYSSRWTILILSDIPACWASVLFGPGPGGVLGFDAVSWSCSGSSSSRCSQSMDGLRAGRLQPGCCSTWWASTSRGPGSATPSSALCWSGAGGSPTSCVGWMKTLGRSAS